MARLIQTAKKESLVLRRKNRRARSLGSQDRTKIIGFAITTILFIVLGALLYAWSNLRITHMGYEIADTLTERRQLIDVNQRLKIELAALRSPERIEAIAVKRGMRTPKVYEFIVIK